MTIRLRHWSSRIMVRYCLMIWLTSENLVARLSQQAVIIVSAGSTGTHRCKLLDHRIPICWTCLTDAIGRDCTIELFMHRIQYALIDKWVFRYRQSASVQFDDDSTNDPCRLRKVPRMYFSKKMVVSGQAARIAGCVSPSSPGTCS